MHLDKWLRIFLVTYLSNNQLFLKLSKQIQYNYLLRPYNDSISFFYTWWFNSYCSRFNAYCSLYSPSLFQLLHCYFLLSWRFDKRAGSIRRKQVPVWEPAGCGIVGCWALPTVFGHLVSWGWLRQQRSQTFTKSLQ